MSIISAVTVTKLEAARRQLDVALDLIFSNGDAIAAHTLVGAASAIVTDLVCVKCPDRSWDTHAQEANKLAPRDYFAIMRRAQNFLKHAKADPNEVLELDPTDTDSLAFWAVMNLGELGCTLSAKESVLQLWYVACYSPVLDEDSLPNVAARQLFGDLRTIDRKTRVSVAARVLAERDTSSVR